MTVTKAQASAAKQNLQQTIATTPGVNGVGLARRGDGWLIRVNVLDSELVAQLPAAYDGVPVEVAVVGPVTAQNFDVSLSADGFWELTGGDFYLPGSGGAGELRAIRDAIDRALAAEQGQ